MRDLEFSFKPAPWELAAAAIKPGGTMSAERLLVLLEGEEEADAEAALNYLRERQIGISLEHLPRVQAAGVLANRLDQEQKLAQQGELTAGLPEGDPLRLCIEDAHRSYAPVTQALIRQALSGEARAVEQLIGGFFPGILECACGLTGRGVALLDLIQDGSMGLLLALSQGDEMSFRERAEWQIRQAMARTVVLEARARGVGSHIAQGMEAYRKADRLLLDRLGRNPTLEEIAEQMGKTVEEAAALERMIRTAQAAAGGQKEPVPQEEDQAVEDTAVFRSRQRIEELLSGVSQADAMLLRLRFGLDGDLPQSPEAVGMRLGLTPEQVVEREAAALAKLRGSENGPQ